MHKNAPLFSSRNCLWVLRFMPICGSPSVVFQGLLMLACVGVYAVLVKSISVSMDISKAILTCMGCTELLCFTFFKTGSLAKSIFNAR